MNYAPEIPAFTDRLQGVVIENRDALQLIREHDSAETLFYVDPPYITDVRSQGASHGYRHELQDEDHIKLLRLLVECEAMVVLSAYQNPVYDDVLLSAGWIWSDVRARADRNGERVERVYLSPTTQCRLGRLELEYEALSEG